MSDYQMGHLKFNPYPTPWECPRCGIINAPLNPSCSCISPQVEAFKIACDLCKGLHRTEDCPNCIKARKCEDICLICNAIHVDGASCQYF